MPGDEIGLFQHGNGFVDSASSTVSCHGNSFVGGEAPSRASVMKSIKESSENSEGFGCDGPIVFSLLGSVHEGLGPVQDLDLGFPIERHACALPEELISSGHIAPLKLGRKKLFRELAFCRSM